MTLSKQDRKRRATAERTRKWRDRLRAAREAEAQAQALRDQQVRDALAAASRPKHACDVPSCPERDVHNNLGSYWYCGRHSLEAMNADHFRHHSLGLPDVSTANA
jgi:hypothetical protein